MNKTEIPMPSRERFLDICHGKRLGDVAIFDRFHRYWPETPEMWVKQGAPEEILTTDGYSSYFQLDHMYDLEEIIVGVSRIDLKKDPSQRGSLDSLDTPPIIPVFEAKVLREDEHHRVEYTHGGQTIEVSKLYPNRMPKYLDHPVKDWATWSECKKRLDPDTPERLPRNWAAFVEERNSEDAPTLLVMTGFFGTLRELSGLERLLYWFYDEPKLVDDMMEQVLCLLMGVAKRVVKDLRIDLIRFWEDMAYKTGPLISPDMFKKFMTPRYRKITDFLRSNGVDVLQVDCDGNVDELIPLWLEVGVNYQWPLEVAAGMDGVALRKKYGKDLILGGNIDKRVFAQGKEAVHKEVMSKVPFLLESGPYLPSLDHAIPPDVPLESFYHYLNLLREIGGREKLSEY